ncbi:MAG: RdgB/HAM1 family non-canonical purine NTP pyrophosphatase [Spongiibacteraceae bacterium]
MSTNKSGVPRGIVIASGNSGKLREISSLLASCNFTLHLQSTLAVVEAEETAPSFVENALLKARNAAKQTGMSALADDSGLCVNALNGAPGIYSARYAGDAASDTDNNTKLLQALENTDDRQAHFHCALVFVRHADDPAPIICEGIWPGEILSAPKGSNGFGYDPLFFIAEENCSSAELSAERKNAISHRGRALTQLLPRLLREL